MQAEQVGEDCHGHLGGAVGERGAVPGLGGDAESAEPFGGDRPSRQQAGKQPFTVGGPAGAGVGLAVSDEGEQQVVEGLGTGPSAGRVVR